MKRFVLCAILLAFSAWILADGIVGSWLTDKDKSKVEISFVNGHYSGKIVWLKDPSFPAGDPDAGKTKNDRNNPVASLKTRPLCGIQLMWGFTQDTRSGKYADGKIYDPESGKTYNCTMKLEGDILKVRGSIPGFPMLGRTTEWRRVK
jgi:uncharacterized protein (DUF2147 family)